MFEWANVENEAFVSLDGVLINLTKAPKNPGCELLVHHL
jgi:hypothetical protein